jgi:hypothetical protein
MWTISSTDVEQAKERIDRCRAELEARYAGEKQALDAESAELQTLERAAAEFAQRRIGTGFPPVAALTGAAQAQTEAQDNAAEIALSAVEPSAQVAETAPAPAGEIDPDGYDEANLSLDILKPGSRWRLNRAARLLNPDSGSEPT